MPRKATLYLHFPCFDGVVSSVLTCEYLESQGWKFGRFCPTSYTLRPAWLSTRLSAPCAVVDFLYHPDAKFWADHHLTTFVNESARNDFVRRKENESWLFYDTKAGSCALLLWEKLADFFETEASPRFREMVDWANRIDSARYSSVEEAVLGDEPAIQISFSLARNSSRDYCEFLIRALRRGTLRSVARLPEVRKRYQETRALIEVGLSRFRSSAQLVDGDIVVFDVEAKEKDMISRYAPFFFFPHARYSIGILRRAETAKITAMRNPWIEFKSAPLGSLFERFGGGGHQRVGAVILGKDRYSKARMILNRMISEIRKTETANTSRG